MAKNKKINYLALGDSLAAGQTPYHQWDKSYADYIAGDMQKGGMLGSFNKNYAVSGYTTSDVLKDIQSNKNGIKTNIMKSQVITLDAGANDILRNIDFSIQKKEATFDLFKVLTALQTIQINTEKILDTIHALNPQAKVYVLGYYQPFPHVNKNIQDEIEPLIANLNGILQSTAQNKKATFIPTVEPIRKHAKAYIPNPQDIHPGLEGYKVMAEEAWKVMRQEISHEQRNG